MQRDYVETILKVAQVVPAINQLEFHPYLQAGQRLGPVDEGARHRGVFLQGPRPITAGRGGPLDKPLEQIAIGHGVTVDAVLLR